MRIEIRASQLPGSEPTPHELVITYYETPDGKTCHSRVIAMSRDELVELVHVCERHLLTVIASEPVTLARCCPYPDEVI